MNKLLFVINNPGYLLFHRAPPAAAALREGWDVHVAVSDGGDIGKSRDGGSTYDQFI